MDKKLQWSKENSKKLLHVAGFIVASALLTAGSEFITQVDFGQWTPIVMALWNVVLAAGREFLRSDR